MEIIRIYLRSYFGEYMGFNFDVYIYFLVSFYGTFCMEICLGVDFLCIYEL